MLGRAAGRAGVLSVSIRPGSLASASVLGPAALSPECPCLAHLLARRLAARAKDVGPPGRLFVLARRFTMKSAMLLICVTPTGRIQAPASSRKHGKGLTCALRLVRLYLPLADNTVLTPWRYQLSSPRQRALACPCRTKLLMRPAQDQKRSETEQSQGPASAEFP